MARYTTLKDVAKLAGTTAPTVSYVLSGKEGRYISDELRERVLKAAEESGYIKSSPASSLHGKRRGVIAVLVPQFSNQYFTQLVAAVDAVVEQHGYLSLICNTFDDPVREREVLTKTAQQRVDGYILIPTLTGAENTTQIRKIGVPLVTVDRPLVGVDDDHAHISPDNYGCGYVLGQHLGEMGHSDVAFLGWDSGFRTLDDRRVGFWDGLESTLGTKPIERSYTSAFTVEGAYGLTGEVLRAHPGITALCLGFNVVARGSIDYLTEHGLVPGRDISVTLIGAPDWATTGQNDITLADPNAPEMGSRAARELIHLLEESEQPHEPSVVGYEFRRGNSVTGIR